MKPDKTTVFDLFYNQRQFAVPLFQRPYVWTLEGQWRPLWQDIEDKASAVLENQHTETPHFLGAIVTSQRRIFGNRIGSYDIIDGQQRLTTLQLLLTAFRDVMKARNEHKYDIELERITQNDGIVESDDERFKVWPTNVDRGVFRSVMRSQAIDVVVNRFPTLRGKRRRSVPKIAEAYVFFYRSIERFLDGRDDQSGVPAATARAEAIFKTVRWYLQLVNIELEAGDDPQVIFEALNGRGVPLLPSDLVRNLVFMRANSSTATDTDAMYANYWKQYDEVGFGAESDGTPWWKVEVRQGRLKRPRLDLFLFHYVQYRQQQEVNIGHLFQEFRKWWERSAVENPAAALQEMQRFASTFRELIDPKGRTRLDEFARWLIAIDTGTVYPLLFQLLVGREHPLPEDDRRGVVDDLESYLVRRAVCGLTNKAYNRFFINLMRKLSGVTTDLRSALRAELASGKGETSRWPNDEEFGRHFIHRPAYQALRRSAVAKILDSLEQSLVSRVNDDSVAKAGLSIEHVMPQEWQEHWGIENAGEEFVERRDTVLHSFGNLTLVTPAFNSRLSNREFDIKLKEIKRTSLLRMNQYFWTRDLKDWDESGIAQRGRELFEASRFRWPHPDSPASVDGLSLELPPDSSWRAGEDEDEPGEPPIEVGAASRLLEEFAALSKANGEEGVNHG